MTFIYMKGSWMERKVNAENCVWTCQLPLYVSLYSFSFFFLNRGLRSDGWFVCCILCTLEIQMAKKNPKKTCVCLLLCDFTTRHLYILVCLSSKRTMQNEKQGNLSWFIQSSWWWLVQLNHITVTQVTGSENQHHNEGNVFNHPKDPRQKMKFIWGEENRNSFTCGIL